MHNRVCVYVFYGGENIGEISNTYVLGNRIDQNTWHLVMPKQYSSTQYVSSLPFGILYNM